MEDHDQLIIRIPLSESYKMMIAIGLILLILEILEKKYIFMYLSLLNILLLMLIRRRGGAV